MSKEKISNTRREFTTSARIVVESEGPYLLYGKVPITQQFIMPDRLDESWYYQEGRSFSSEEEPTRLCRCGASKSKPYCDFQHLKIRWNPRLTAELDHFLDHAHLHEGETLDLRDNEKYCVYARFCHPAGGAWHLAKGAKGEAEREMAIRESAMCPGGRLEVSERGEQLPYEFDFEPTIALLEDPAIGASGGLWLRGGIRVEREDGMSYQQRNRVVLCRCGNSNNKPFCDGTHAAISWSDQIEGEPTGEILPAEA